jgi:D-serine dehydratase
MSDPAAVDSARLSQALADCSAGLLDGRTKGFPPMQGVQSLASVRSLGLNVLRQDLPFPVCIAKESAIQGNRLWMRGFLASSGVLIAPHAKTTMSPQLLAMQLQDGAWGFTVATAQQLCVLRSCGMRRILIANQLVGKANVQYVYQELDRDPSLEVYALVDSPDSLAHILKWAPLKGAGCLALLVEVGADGGRTGCRSPESAIALAQRIASSGSRVRLGGIEAYESVFPNLEAGERLQRIEHLLDQVIQVADHVGSAGWFKGSRPLLSAGGSEYFDRVAARLRTSADTGQATVLLRSGCYITQDDLAYARAYQNLKSRSPQMCPPGQNLTAALEVWAVVQSRPEPGLALLTAGKRDVSYDFEMPVPVRWFRPGTHVEAQPVPDGCRIRRLNDQHAFLEFPTECEFEVGDLVGLGISHPCTTFDKWSLIYMVDDNYEVRDGLATYF